MAEIHGVLIGLALGVQTLLIVLAAWLASGGALRRRVGLVVGFLPLGIHQDPASRSLAEQFWHLVAGFDTRLAATTRPRFDTERFAKAAAWTVTAASIATAAFLVMRRLDGWPRYLLRWAACVAFVVSMLEAVASAGVAVYRVFGIEPPPVHNRPYLSRSVAELWGVRWNKVVGRWLRVSFYAPFARRGAPRAGLVAAFAMSALLQRVPHACRDSLAVGARDELVLPRASTPTAMTASR